MLKEASMAIRQACSISRVSSELECRRLRLRGGWRRDGRFGRTIIQFYVFSMPEKQRSTIFRATMRARERLPHHTSVTLAANVNGLLIPGPGETKKESLPSA